MPGKERLNHRSKSITRLMKRTRKFMTRHLRPMSRSGGSQSAREKLAEQPENDYRYISSICE